MKTLTLLEQLNKSPKWAEFEKWYEDWRDSHAKNFHTFNIEVFKNYCFDIQKGVFEKFIQSSGYWVATHDYSNQVSLIKDSKKYSEFDGTFEELLIYYFNLPSYWEWYWGTDLNDLTKHSEKIKFTDFNEMKDFSAMHSYSCKHLKPNYWSSYDVIEI